MASADVGYTCPVSGLARDTDREALLKTDSKVLNHRGIRSETFSSENSTRDAVQGMNGGDLDGCAVSKHLGGPNAGSGDHGGGPGVSIRRSNVRLFRLGGLIVGLSLVGGLSLGLGYDGRCVALGVGVHDGFLSATVRHGKTKRK
ncbi:hypothetical protein K1719_043104 [Acacia pycnantha]|nr:hypothetical protein K1719_043104 [Acacia pycnantha]